jgi:hypothetical protein
MAKKKRNCGCSIIEDSMERWSASLFSPPILVRRGGFWAKHIGFKARCYWEQHWGTHREYIGNQLKGTCWEQRRKEKKSFPPPKKNLKGKKSRHFECILGLPIGCMKFLFPKLLVTIFGLG